MFKLNIQIKFSLMIGSLYLTDRNVFASKENKEKNEKSTEGYMALKERA